MKSVLITGGAGFLGSNIAAAIAALGTHKTIVCDRYGSSDKWRNLAKHPIDETITPEELFYWLDANGSSLEAIIHMGAISSTTEKNVDLILETNFGLSRVLWQWCVTNQVRFIYASDAATYGNGDKGFDDAMSLGYLSSLVPLNGFGWSKHLFDQFVARRVANKEPQPPQWVGLKFFSIYGPNEYHKENQRSVLCQLFPHADKTGHVKLFKSYHPSYKDGGQRRDFIYVKDCVNVVMWFLANPDKNGIFNCGTGEARTFDDLAKSLFAALGKEPHITYVDIPEAIKDKYQYFTQATTDRLREVGYPAPFTPLETGVRDYVQNYLLKEDPYL